MFKNVWDEIVSITPTSRKPSPFQIDWNDEETAPIEGQHLIICLDGEHYLIKHSGLENRGGEIYVKTDILNEHGRVIVPIKDVYLVSDGRDSLIQNMVNQLGRG